MKTAWLLTKYNFMLLFNISMLWIGFIMQFRIYRFYNLVLACGSVWKYGLKRSYPFIPYFFIHPCLATLLWKPKKTNKNTLFSKITIWTIPCTLLTTCNTIRYKLLFLSIMTTSTQAKIKFVSWMLYFYVSVILKKKKKLG